MEVPYNISRRRDMLLVREHFTNPAGFHTSCAASSTGITLRFGSDGVFVVASVGTLLQVPPAKTTGGALYERRGRNDAQKIAHGFLFGCL